MGVILRHFLRLTSPEMGSAFKTSGTESHYGRRESSGYSRLSPTKSSLFEKRNSACAGNGHSAMNKQF